MIRPDYIAGLATIEILRMIHPIAVILIQRTVSNKKQAARLCSCHVYASASTGPRSATVLRPCTWNPIESPSYQSETATQVDPSSGNSKEPTRTARQDRNDDVSHGHDVGVFPIRTSVCEAASSTEPRSGHFPLRAAGRLSAAQHIEKHERRLFTGHCTAGAIISAIVDDEAGGNMMSFLGDTLLPTAGS